MVPVWGAEGKALLRRKRFSAYPRSFSLGSATPNESVVVFDDSDDYDD